MSTRACGGKETQKKNNTYFAINLCITKPGQYCITQVIVYLFNIDGTVLANATEASSTNLNNEWLIVNASTNKITDFKETED